MALIKYSALVSEMKGKLNGSIFSNPKYGAQVRNRRSLGGRKTTAWAQSRNILAYIASTWKSLSDGQRETFSTVAPDYQYLNKFGDLVTPSGYQLFCRLNLNLHYADFSPIVIAASPFPEIDISPVEVSFTAPSTINLSFTPEGSGDERVLVYVSPPQSPGVQYPPARMALVHKFLADSSSPQLISDGISSKYGNITKGAVYWVKCRLVHIDTGQRYGDYLTKVTAS